MERGISQVQRTKSLYALLLARLHYPPYATDKQPKISGGSNFYLSASNFACTTHVVLTRYFCLKV